MCFKRSYFGLVLVWAIEYHLVFTKYLPLVQIQNFVFLKPSALFVVSCRYSLEQSNLSFDDNVDMIRNLALLVDDFVEIQV